MATVDMVVAPSAPVRRRRLLRIPSRHGIWARLSKVGERVGWDWLTYNPGIFKSFYDCAVRNAPILADAVLPEYPGVKTFVDVGCGPGGYLAEFRRRGLSVQGFEYSPRGRRWCRKQGLDVQPFDVFKRDTPDPPVRADLVLSTEVGEHIPAPLADAFVRFIASCGDRIIFTADQPRGKVVGVGHINEQPPAYWIAKFEALGYTFDKERTSRIARKLRDTNAQYYLPENLSIFERK